VAILMKQTPVGKRAHYISNDAAEKMVDDGQAIHCAPYDIYEEVTDGESAQGYMTRNMTPLTPGKRKFASAKKVERKKASNEEADK